MKGMLMFDRRLVVFCFTGYLIGCGHSQQEWDQQVRENQVLKHQVQAQQAAVSSCGETRQGVEKRLQSLTETLAANGLKEATLESDLARERLAGEEYRTRLSQLTAVEQSLQRLRAGLGGAAAKAVASVRDNRLRIVVGADTLFAEGGSTLTEAGRSLLQQVAGSLQSDPWLARRHFQVAGHTAPTSRDDDWKVSLARASSVLAFLTKSAAQGGGGLPASNLSVAGFGAQDPVVPNASPGASSKNSRIELVLMPHPAEMLNLEQLARGQ